MIRRLYRFWDLIFTGSLEVPRGVKGYPDFVPSVPRGKLLCRRAYGICSFLEFFIFLGTFRDVFFLNSVRDFFNVTYQLEFLVRGFYISVIPGILHSFFIRTS